VRLLFGPTEEGVWQSLVRVVAMLPTSTVITLHVILQCFIATVPGVVCSNVQSWMPH
jgi:hypothetical protein